MMCYVHYISAVRRLKEMNKGVELMEPDVPPMMLAQRDFLEKEVEWFAEDCWNMSIKIAVVCLCLCALIVFTA